MKRLLFFIISLFFASQVQADEYSYYFSDDATGSAQGSDAADCSIGTPCKTLSKAQERIDAAAGTDTVNLYFDRSDTWTMDTDAVATTVFYGLRIGSDDPIVHIDAYGTGAKPKFDGTVTDFSTVPAHNATTGPFMYNLIICIEKSGSSVKNLHINGVYGHGIMIGWDYPWPGTYADNITIESCDITNFGNTGIMTNSEWGTSNTTITKNLIHTGQQLIRYNKMNQLWWGAGFGLAAGAQSSRVGQNNTVTYNVVYDIAGEGIHSSFGVVEYNIVGDTSSVGIYHCPQQNDGVNAIYRYNLVTMSSSETYKNLPTQGYHGIGLADETSGDGDDNSNSTVQVYGNIIINRRWGIYVANYDTTNNSPYGEVRIFNNTVIDSYYANFVFQHLDDVLAGHGFFYNNASILYDKPGSIHATCWEGYTGFSTYWTVDNNAFWTTGGSPTVDLAWRTNYKVANPLLAGEEQETPVDWDGQTGATYFSDITFANITPNTGSSLIDTGKTLAYEDTFLSAATFADLPATQTFTLDDQSGNWDIGAALVSFDPTPTFVSAQIDPSGTTASVTFSEALTSAADVGTFSFTDFAGGAIVATYSSGEGTATLVFTLDRTVAGSETDGLLEYTPGDWVDSDSNALATFSGETVSNYSGVPDPTPPNYSASSVHNKNTNGSYSISR